MVKLVLILVAVAFSFSADGATVEDMQRAINLYSNRLGVALSTELLQAEIEALALTGIKSGSPLPERRCIARTGGPALREVQTVLLTAEERLREEAGSRPDLPQLSNEQLDQIVQDGLGGPAKAVLQKKVEAIKNCLA